MTKYEHNVPEPQDVHIKLLGAQMIAGLNDIDKDRRETTLIEMLPKKKNPPPLRRE